VRALDAELALVFALAAGLAGYAYVGYPLLLALRARLRPAPAVARAPATPAVSIVIVAHNEAGRIGLKLRNCLALDYPRERVEVIVASDGSTDGTCEEVESFAAQGVRLLRLPGPNGKPTALNAAVPLARGELLLLCDTRQELEPQALRALTANLADPAVGAVSGELQIRAGGTSAAAEGVGAYWRYEKWIRRTESRVGSTVGVTGAIYAVRRELFPRLDPRTILDDVAVPLHVVRRGQRVVFEPEARAWDEAVGDPRREFRRKVRTLAGNYQLVALDPSLLNPARNPQFFGFVSHKLARLAVPWCLLAALVSSLWLAGRGSLIFGALALLQTGFYALAAAGWSLRRRASRPRLVALAYAVVLLNLAAAGALFGFLSGRQQAAWKAS
jgi:cellulose synthase/poly-beta-1,6-N-acetylglucosamine synthase-like glycosyltransferase